MAFDVYKLIYFISIFTGIKLNTLDQTVVEQGIVWYNQEDDDEDRSENVSQVKNEPLPPLQSQYRQPVVHMRSNNANMSGEP